MTKNPIIEQLIDAQLEFLDQEFSSADTIQNEFIAFYHWFRKQSLKNLWSFPQINDLLQYFHEERADNEINDVDFY